MVQFSVLYMTTGKIIALTIWTFVGKVIYLLFNTLFRFVIAFLPRSKLLLISWLQSLSEVIFGAQENKICHCFHFSPSIFHDFHRCHDLSSVSSQLFYFPLSLSPSGSLVSLHSIIRVVQFAYLRLVSP